MRTARFRWLSGLVLLCLVLSGSPNAQAPSESGYVPHRVFDSARKQFTDFEAMLADLSRVDVVAVGEQHDDPATHRLELALLEGMVRLKRPVIVSLEMFERDVQKTLDDYLASRVSESAFLADSRPWPRYATDYRGLVELADRQAWKVVAGNIPRRIAADIGKQGLAAVDALPAADKALVAAERNCPLGDDYHMRFEKEMQQHPPAPGQEATAKAMAERFYYAQCLKDETMAESIVAAVRSAPDPKPLVVHYNGAFHSDYRAGVVARLERRLTGSKIRVVSMVPVEKLEGVDPSTFAGRADYVVFTIKPEVKKTQ
jgi:uncharacterized iron-regulated protein